MDSNVQQFSVTFLKIDCKKCYDIIGWQAFKVTEPPVTKNMTDIELRRMITAQEPPKYLCSRFLHEFVE